MTPLAAKRDTANAQKPLAGPSPSDSTKNPARGIVMGALLSVPLWFGISYLVRWVIGAL